MSEFDYQWKNLFSKDIQFNEDRIVEFQEFTRVDLDRIIRGNYCLDAGCGSGRYTYAMQKLGAMRVDSFDVSSEAVERCKEVNPDAFVFNIMDLQPLPRPVYDFVLCWGVLNHVPEPRKAFSKVASQVGKDNGTLHIMVYHKDTQKIYEEGRAIWHSLSLDQQMRLCEEKVKTVGGTIHGWFDAFNPEYNWSFTEQEIKKWFEEEGLSNIKMITKYNINMNGKFLIKP